MREFLKLLGQEYRDDASNADLARTPRGFATTCCLGWLTIIIPKLLMRSSGWARWHAPRKGPWKTGCERSATPQPCL